MSLVALYILASLVGAAFGSLAICSVARALKQFVRAGKWSGRTAIVAGVAFAVSILTILVTALIYIPFFALEDITEFSATTYLYVLIGMFAIGIALTLYRQKRQKTH